MSTQFTSSVKRMDEREIATTMPALVRSIAALLILR